MEDMRGYISEVFGSFQGEGPRLGERHVFVRFCCCSLNCAYCDTVESRARQPEARIEEGAGLETVTLRNPLSVDTVIDAVLAQEVVPGFNSALSVTGGEPLEQPGFLAALLEGLSGRLKVILETNGTLPDAFREVEPFVDTVSMDIKLPSVSGLGPLWDRHASFLEACMHKELIVKAVFSADTPFEEVGRAARLVAEKAPDALLVLQPLSRDGAMAGLTGDRVLGYYSVARVHHGEVRVIPQVHKILGVK